MCGWQRLYLGCEVQIWRICDLSWLIVFVGSSSSWLSRQNAPFPLVDLSSYGMSMLGGRTLTTFGT